ncbi:iron(III) transport system permease protein [Microbacterium sp. W4I4]|uniref:ABC transporter permease n=1 Tax=Microbacterium sp. W4I4 TaxID=3042295 RepID=UPI00278876F0|nr:iron ABC transporter permease [Microbacterium sp. W4I4]MDQ0615181.1 iron(III) transport system permease protein [Microbacterium sp. W4I4]
MLLQQNFDTATRARGRIRIRTQDRRARNDPTVTIVLLVVIAGLMLILGLPVAKLIGAGFSEDGLAAMIAAITGNSVPLRNTILLGLLVGVVGTAIGFVCAYAQVFLDFRGKRILHWITLLPTISPPFAAATAIVTLFGKRGIVSYQLFGLELNVYGLPGLVMVLSLTFAPVAYMNIKGMFQNLDPSLFEAASTLGATQLRTLFIVTIPMVVPALLASFLVLFVEGIADLANPLVIGGDYRVLASQIYFAVAGSGDIASAAGIALVLLAPALSVFVVQKYWASRKSVITVTGKPTGVVQPVTSKRIVIPIGILAGAWSVFVVLVYSTIIVGGFVKILGVDNTLTLAHYEFVQRLGSTAIGTTLTMTLIAAPIAALTSVTIGWLVVRHLPRAGKVLDFVGMLGAAIPGTVLGLGFALAYSQPTWFLGVQVLPALAGGLAVGSGMIAIIMVYVARGVPTGQQASIAALAQINPQVEEAASSLGANAVTTFRKVTIPLVSGAVVTAITYAITKSMTTITAIIFITTPQTKVMTSQILDEVDAGRFGNAFAYSTILIGMVFVILIIATSLLQLLNRSQKGVRR